MRHNTAQRKNARSLECFGGEINWDDLGFLERTALKMIKKQKGSSSNLDLEAIELMVAAMK